MKTDKQLYKIFAANPQWIFELTSLESPGDCELRAVTLKALEQSSDAVIFPRDENEPLVVLEFQFQDDPTIYTRTAIEMALIQQEYSMREVQGLIFFRYPSLDPQTEPWQQIIRAFQLREVIESLAQRDADHPLVAVFRPVLVSNETTLENHAREYYNQIRNSSLAEPIKSTLVDVFLNWLEQRLKHRGKEEIEKMMLGDLPDIRETQTGKDLIQIGKVEGVQHALVRVLEKKFGAVDANHRQRIEQLKSPEKLEELLFEVMEAEAIDELNW
ncbi:MAG: DUF2887 domain-containing protein [Gemmataceae bacterium]